MSLGWGLQISGGAQGIHRQLGTTGIRSPLAETCLHRATGPMPESNQKGVSVYSYCKNTRETHMWVYIHNSQPSRKMNEVYGASGL